MTFSKDYSRSSGMEEKKSTHTYKKNNLDVIFFIKRTFEETNQNCSSRFAVKYRSKKLILRRVRRIVLATLCSSAVFLCVCVCVCVCVCLCTDRGWSFTETLQLTEKPAFTRVCVRMRLFQDVVGMNLVMFYPKNQQKKKAILFWIKKMKNDFEHNYIFYCDDIFMINTITSNCLYYK